jgi:hypothetical protein
MNFTLIFIFLIILVLIIIFLCTIEKFEQTDINSKEIMCSRMDEYSLDNLYGLAARCDWLFKREQFLNIKNTDKPNIIYITNHDGSISIPYFVNNFLSKINWPVKIIYAHGDYSFPKGNGDDRSPHYLDKVQNEINELINNKYISHIFVENLDTLHPKLSPIPIGLLYELRKMYDLSTDKINMNLKKNNVFCCHRIRKDNTKQWDDRKKVSELCLNKWNKFITYKESISLTEYKEMLIDSKFCICVHGGGLDPCPKAWEALLCGCVPIIKRSTLDEVYNRFPVYFVDDWTEDAITEQKLNNWLSDNRKYYEDINERRKVLNMLTLDYWWDIILNYR